MGEVVELAGRRPPPADRHVAEVHLYETPCGLRYFYAKGPYQDEGAAGQVDLARSLLSAASAQGFKATAECLAEGLPPDAGAAGLVALVAVYHSGRVQAWLTPHLERDAKAERWLQERAIDASCVLSDMVAGRPTGDAQ